MARAVSPQKKWTFTILGVARALIPSSPILWTFLTAFKTEGDADLRFRRPSCRRTGRWKTSSRCRSAPNYCKHFFNSMVISIRLDPDRAGHRGAWRPWSMAFSPAKRTRDILMWMLSTKMMPAVGVLVPIYLIFKNLGLLDTLGA